MDAVVIGAGSSGLAALAALRRRGLSAQCFERGSDVGGLWRYQNDNGLSSAYASLRTNVSRPRMQYPSLPMPAAYGDFPSHVQMAAYLSDYAQVFGLRESICFGVNVERLEPEPAGGWRLELDDGSACRAPAVVVAVGHDWSPALPDHPGELDGTVSHAHDYRTPEPFAGRRVLVVGAGQSAAEIAVEVATVAARTCISMRGGVHVIPRRIRGEPYDSSDVAPLNRMPWRLVNRVYGWAVAAELGPPPPGWPPPPSHRLLEGIPVLSSDLLPALRRGEIAVRPAVERLEGACVRFADGTAEPFDHVLYATGYRIELPFLAPSLLPRGRRELPLYRRIVPPSLRGLFLAGFVDAPGGLLPLVETQGEWIAAVLGGALRLPAPEAMRAAIERSERRTRQRFPAEGSHSIRCDPHAYRRLLRADLRRSSPSTLGPRPARSRLQRLVRARP